MKKENDLDKFSGDFKNHIDNILKNSDSDGIFEKISERHNIYIFSGVTRDFFLKNKNSEIRDLDLVIEEKDDSLKITDNPSKIDLLINEIKSTNSNHICRKNSFGGCKIKRSNLSIDLWYLEDTWGIKEKQIAIKPESLLETTFFNFSSIVFDYMNLRFIYNEVFKDFIDSKKMDVVFEKNPSNALCIINSMYYSKKLKFELSDKLKHWIRNNYREDLNFIEVQNKHFSKEIFNSDEILNFVNLLTK